MDVRSLPGIFLTADDVRTALASQATDELTRGKLRLEVPHIQLIYGFYQH